MPVNQHEEWAEQDRKREEKGIVSVASAANILPPFLDLLQLALAKLWAQVQVDPIGQLSLTHWQRNKGRPLGLPPPQSSNMYLVAWLLP